MVVVVDRVCNFSVCPYEDEYIFYRQCKLVQWDSYHEYFRRIGMTQLMRARARARARVCVCVCVCVCARASSVAISDVC